MYLKHLYIFIIISTLSIKAFGQRALDTIYANEHQNVALFFPYPIQKAVTGHQGFVFTYNREKEEHLGLLQAVPGKHSNLLVITDHGTVYSFPLVYAKTLPSYNYFVTTEESIGTVRPNQDKENNNIKVMESLEKQQERFKSRCSFLLENNPENLVTKRKRGLRFRLESMTYHGDEVYLLMDIQNKSGIDLELEHLAITTINGSKKRRASFQEIPMDMAYTYKKPQMIRAGKQQRFVCVVPKFVLGDKEKLRVQLWEKSGSRSISLLVKK